MIRTLNAMLLTMLLMAIPAVLFAQDDKSKRASPPAKAEGKAGEAMVVIDYSQPSVKGRTLWGELVPYGKVWRTGANEATIITVDNDVMVQGQRLNAGKYALFTIPEKDEWTVIFNKTAEQWGAYDYNENEDALRVKVKPEKSGNFMERMTFKVEDDKLVLYWGDTMIPISIKDA